MSKKRKSPPIPANECIVNTVKEGNDGEYWQARQSGKSLRWTKCFKKIDDCDNLPENQFWGVSGYIFIKCNSHLNCVQLSYS
jgi:hypothetical protein